MSPFKGQISAYTDGRSNAATYCFVFFILFCQGELMCANYDLTSVDSIQMWFAICDFPCEFHYSRAGYGKRDILMQWRCFSGSGVIE